jgi:hypothetical protein
MTKVFKLDDNTLVEIDGELYLVDDSLTTIISNFATDDIGYCVAESRFDTEPKKIVKMRSIVPVSYNLTRIIASTRTDLNLPIINMVDLKPNLYQIAITESEKDINYPYRYFRGKTIGVDDEHTGQALRGAFCQGFEQGYNANNKEFTKEQIRNAITFGMEIQQGLHGDVLIDDYINHLQPKLIGLEVEMTEVVTNGWVPTYNNPDNSGCDQQYEINIDFLIGDDNTLVVRPIYE